MYQAELGTQNKGWDRIVQWKRPTQDAIHVGMYENIVSEHNQIRPVSQLADWKQQQFWDDRDDEQHNSEEAASHLLLLRRPRHPPAGGRCRRFSSVVRARTFKRRRDWSWARISFKQRTELREARRFRDRAKFWVYTRTEFSKFWSLPRTATGVLW